MNDVDQGAACSLVSHDFYTNARFVVIIFDYGNSSLVR